MDRRNFMKAAGVIPLAAVPVATTTQSNLTSSSTPVKVLDETLNDIQARIWQHHLEQELTIAAAPRRSGKTTLLDLIATYHLKQGRSVALVNRLDDDEFPENYPYNAKTWKMIRARVGEYEQEPRPHLAVMGLKTFRRIVGRMYHGNLPCFTFHKTDVWLFNEVRVGDDFLCCLGEQYPNREIKVVSLYTPPYAELQFYCDDLPSQKQKELLRYHPDNYDHKQPLTSQQYREHLEGWNLEWRPRPQ